MTKKKKNEMPVYGVTCSKCHSDEIVMNTDTKELVCCNCGQVTEPDLILNSKDFNVKEFPTISVNDKVSRNEDNIDILDENTKRLFDMITKLEAKVDKLATESNADKVPTNPEKCIENTISDLEYKSKLHTQHIEECYGTISRIKNDIDNLTSNDFKLNDDSKELHSTISENIADIKTLRKDLGDLSVKTKDAIKEIQADYRERLAEAFRRIENVADEVNALETKVNELVGNVEDIRNHLRANSTRITHLQKGLSGCENRVDNIEDKIADMCGELNDADHITTFGDLKVGDKFKIHGTTTPYLKVGYMKNKCLAYNILFCRCRTIPDDYLVVPIDDGDDGNDVED